MKFTSVSCGATKKVQVDGESNNLYKILNLSPKNASMDDIKRAYRRMALKYHPDVCHNRLKKEESTRMFVQLNVAYNTLSNPRLKAEYDFELGLDLRSNNNININVSDNSWKNKWMEQLVELKRRSHTRMEQKGGSWGSRMRAQNNIKDDDHN